MTTDFRALCAELLDEMDYYTDWSDAKEVKDRARAALAEPQPEPPAEGEVAELVTWLLDRGEDAAANGWDHQARQFGRAAELLQRLKPELPTDEELMEVFWGHNNGMEELWAGDWLAAARAVLARWGNHPGSPDSSTPQPIPVSERLPGPGGLRYGGKVLDLGHRHLEA